MVFQAREGPFTAEMMFAYSAHELLRLDEAGVETDPDARGVALAAKSPAGGFRLT